MPKLSKEALAKQREAKLAKNLLPLKPTKNQLKLVQDLKKKAKLAKNLSKKTEK